MSFQISNLHNKRMRTPIHQSRLLPSYGGLRNIQLRHNNRMIRRPAHRPIPPLGRRESRTMKDEFPSLGIPGRTTLQSFDIGAVAEFRLGITSNSLPGTDFGKPVFSLLGVALLSDSGFEHLRMHHTEKRKSVLFTYLEKERERKRKSPLTKDSHHHTNNPQHSNPLHPNPSDPPSDAMSSPAPIPTDNVPDETNSAV